MRASTVIERAGIALFDTKHVRWTQPELIGYINDAQRQIVTLRPDSNSVVASLLLTPGTRQQLPVTRGNDPNGTTTPPGLRLLRVNRNMGVDGQTPGRAVREYSSAVLDNEIPDWQTMSATAVEGFIYDTVTPTTFYVYPGAPPLGTVYVEAAYSGMPAAVVSGASGVPTPASDDLDLPDQYLAPVIDYVLARCYAKDAAYAGDTARAQAHMQAFSSTLGVSLKLGEIASSPQKAQPTPAATQDNVR